MTFPNKTLDMDATDSRRCKSFHPFPRLPMELRSRIWKLACHPRTVIIQYRYRIPSDGGVGRFTSQTNPPAIMETCRESRASAIYKQFSPMPTTTSPVVDRVGNSEFIWINLDQDAIQMTDYALTRLDSKHASMIRHLRVHVENLRSFHECNISSFNKLERLQSLTLVFMQDVRASYTDRRDCEVAVLSCQSAMKSALGHDQTWVSPDIQVILAPGTQPEDFRKAFQFSLEGHGRGGRRIVTGGPPPPMARRNGHGIGQGFLAANTDPAPSI